MQTKKLKLPSMTHVFNINVTGVETGRHYDGQFTYIRPNLNQKSEIEKMNVRLNGDLKNISPALNSFNEMSSILYFTIIDAPDWWNDSNNGRNLYDINVIEAIYGEIVKYEDDWKNKVWGDKKEDIEPNKKK